MSKELICYCFEYSEEDIIDDFRKNNGTSKILEKITRAKKTGRCRCETKHPEKR